MKLIYEQTAGVSFEKSVNEAQGGKSTYKISGIFSTMGEKNKNGRVYPNAIWEREVNEYQSTLETGASNSLMELNHPTRADVDMMEAVAKITKLYIKDKFVMGEAVLLDNPKANQLKTLIDNGIKMAVSSRGVGKVSATGMVENFKLSTYDIIPDQGQSDHNAQMMGIVEGILTDKDFEILENGCVGECSLDVPETVSEASTVDVSNYKNISDMKEILKEYDAEILCDLGLDDKEAVLSKFRDETSVSEAKFQKLAEDTKAFEEYALAENKKLKDELAEMNGTLKDEALKEKAKSDVIREEEILYQITEKKEEMKDFFASLTK